MRVSERERGTESQRQKVGETSNRAVISSVVLRVLAACLLACRRQCSMRVMSLMVTMRHL